MCSFIQSLVNRLPMVKIVRRELANYPRRGRIIDLGCGTGGNTALLVSTAGEVVGIDIDRARIKKASERYPGIDFRPMDAARTEFADGYFDTAFMVMSLHEAACTGDVIREACRIAGEVVIIDYSRIQYGCRRKLVEFIEKEKYERFADINLPTVFAGCGFSLRESRRIHPALYIYFFVRGKADRLKNALNMK
ncbi:MAG: class I SAM-dependent methyltransferase [Firmicutes bacterium]|nr:class I SAM-dependent methyltransferase [Bacillota bacterium]MCL5056853.1 class I SAM-dependent methyltransferase [Actinomycetota bacterium]